MELRHARNEFSARPIATIVFAHRACGTLSTAKKADEFIKSYEKFDYFEFRNASNLSLEGSLVEARLFYAIYKSGVRLIDNLEI